MKKRTPTKEMGAFVVLSGSGSGTARSVTRQPGRPLRCTSSLTAPFKTRCPRSWCFERVDTLDDEAALNAKKAVVMGSVPKRNQPHTHFSLLSVLRRSKWLAMHIRRMWNPAPARSASPNNSSSHLEFLSLVHPEHSLL